MDRSFTIQRFALVPWKSGFSPDVDGVLEAYHDRAGHQIKSATLVHLAAEPLTRDLNEDERSDLFDLAMALGFAALARRELCGRWGSSGSRYANADSFRLIIQGFREGDPRSVAEVVRRRGGRVTTAYMRGTFEVRKPPHVDLLERYTVDSELVESVLTVLDSPDRAIYEESIFSFNNANTDSDQVPVQHEIVALVGAFERLTGKSGKADPLARAVVDLLRPYLSADRLRHLTRLNRFEAEHGSFDGSGNRVLSSSVTEAWLRDLYRTRNAFGHGRRVYDHASLWHPEAHLLIGAHVFPLAVLVRLANDGQYVLTQDDADRIFAIPRLVTLRKTLRWTNRRGSVWHDALRSALDERRWRRTTMAMKGAYMTSFVIEPQIHRDACIAASACSLLRWLKLPSPRQEDLDPLVQAGMKANKNGFNSLRDALTILRATCTVTRHTPSPQELAHWIGSVPSAAFLIAHRVRTGRGIGAHITVLFKEDGGWYRADPGTGKVTAVDLPDLVANYAGDVAVIA